MPIALSAPRERVGCHGRRFYSPSLLAGANAADQRIRYSETLSAANVVCYMSVLPGIRAARTGTDGSGVSGLQTSLFDFSTLSWAFQCILCRRPVRRGSSRGS